MSFSGLCPPPFPSSPKSYLSFSLYGTVYVLSEGEPTDVHLVAGTDVHDAGLLSFLCINVYCVVWKHYRKL